MNHRQLLEAALGVTGAAGRRKLARQLLALAEADRDQVGVDRRDLALTDGYLHRARESMTSLTAGDRCLPLSSALHTGHEALIEPRPGINTQRKVPMSRTVILSSARTPFGKMGGTLSSLDATDLGGHAISAALERSGVAPDQVEQVVFGQVL